MGGHAHSGTCYAQAAATVLRSAELRIVGRELKPHRVIVERIVAKHGTRGGYVNKVLEEECPSKCLRFREVQTADASRCLDLGRALLFSFWLTDDQWEAFSDFFRRTPSSILEELPTRAQDSKRIGHGAVIIGHSEDTWLLKNSWGDDFAQDGYFKISKALITDAGFTDVFFYEHELRAEDHAAYARMCKNELLHTIEE